MPPEPEVALPKPVVPLSEKLPAKAPLVENADPAAQVLAARPAPQKSSPAAGDASLPEESDEPTTALAYRPVSGPVALVKVDEILEPFFAGRELESPPTGQSVVAQSEGEQPDDFNAYAKVDYLAGPEATPASAELIAINELLLAGRLQEALFGIFDLLDVYSRTREAVHVQNMFNRVLGAMKDARDGGNAAPLFDSAAALPDETAALMEQYQSLEARYALMEFYEVCGRHQLENLDDLSLVGAEPYGRKILEIATLASTSDVTHPLQHEMLNFHFGAATLLGGAAYDACIAHMEQLAEGEPSIVSWSARMVLASYHLLPKGENPARIFHYGRVIADLEASGIPEILADPMAYVWLKATLAYAVGAAYFALGDDENAKPYLEMTLAYSQGRKPKSNALMLLAWIAARQHPHDPMPAITLFADYLNRYPDGQYAPQALLALASLYHVSRDYEGAIELYNALMERYPESGVTAVAQHEIEYIQANQRNSVEVAMLDGAGDAATLAMRCGPRALQKLLALEGVHQSLDVLSASARTDARGTTMQALIEAAEREGLALVGVEVASLDGLDAPFIAFVDRSHFVTVSSVSEDRITIFDDSDTETALTPAEFMARWSGQALVRRDASHLARRLDRSTLEALYGGNGSPSTPDLPADDDEPPCKAKRCKKCPPDGPCKGNICYPPPPPGGNCPGGQSIMAPPGDSCGTGNGKFQSTAGSPGSPEAASGFNSPGVSAEIDTFTLSLELDEADLSLTTLGAWGLSFERTYRCNSGYLRPETTDAAYPWENNIGAGWSHNLNLHLRTDGAATPAKIVYWDTNGTTRTYSYDSSAGGYDIYHRSTTGSAAESGNVLKRHTASGAFTLELAGGATIDFSAAGLGDYARVTAQTDAMGHTVTFSYDHATVGLGKLIKVQSPAGDAQHLALTYTGNLISLVELKTNSTVLNSVAFAYNGSNQLIEVTDHAAKTVEYAYGTYGSAPATQFITKITNKSAVETDLTWTFGLNSVSKWEASSLEVENGDGLVTVYDRSLTTSICTITNWDGVTLLNKIINTPVTGNRNLSSSIDYFIDATNYERWAYTYDADYQLIEVTAPGNVPYAEYTYNAAGNVLTQQFGTGPVTEYEYDADGLQVTKIIDTAGIETTYTYDVNGLPEKKTHPALHTDGERYEYNVDGLLTKVTSPLGTETVYTYDAYGRTTSVVQDPGGLAITTSYVYDDLGNMIEMTDPRGETTEYVYGDPSCGGCGGGGHLEMVTDALGRETEWIYNSDGLLETTIDASGIETDYTYDAMGRVVEIEHPAGSTITSTTTYDKLGRVASRTDFGGSVTSYAYDHMGRTTTVTDAVGDIDYVYNSLGQLVTVTDSLGHNTTNNYDTAFRLTEVVDEIGKETHYVYDAAGRQESVGAGTSGTVDPTTYNYDPTTGQLASVEYGSSTYTASYEYDGEGRLVKLTDWIDAVDGLRYGYDAVGRLETITDYDDSVLTYTYDDGGNVLSMVDYHGNTTSYTYNDIGQLDTLTAPGSKVWDYTYDTGNRLTRVDIPNGMHTEYTYDASGRQDSIHHKDGATVKQGFDYTFDNGGNITRIDHEDGSYWAYDYDGRDRLIEAIRGNAASPTILATYEYTYDDGDNMLTKTLPWYDDFQDGNATGWSGHTANYSVVDGELRNTLDASQWRDLYLSESDADHDLKFDYIRYTSTGAAWVILRYTDNNNYLYLDINPTVIHLRQRDGGTTSTLDTMSTTVAEDVKYQVRAILDGANVQVFWGAEGASFDEILSTSSATELTTARAAYFRLSTNSEHGFDNVQLIAGTRNTVEPFTYNDANEQITHAKNGVTTTMTYDDWGRLEERDDGTHTATYAYRYGGKLYSVTSGFPGEGNVAYETGGDKKRRSRIAGASTTGYNWDVGLNLISEENGAGTVLRTYTDEPLRGRLSLRNLRSRALGVSLGSNPATGLWGYLALDPIWSVRGAFDQSKQQVAEFEYTPYGDVFARSTNLSIVATFASHQWDESARMYSAPFRFYSAERTRWSQRDPLGMIDGINIYRYEGTTLDPLGLYQIPWDIINRYRTIPDADVPGFNNCADDCMTCDQLCACAVQYFGIDSTADGLLACLSGCQEGEKFQEPTPPSYPPGESPSEQSLDDIIPCGPPFKSGGHPTNDFTFLFIILIAVFLTISTKKAAADDQ